MKGLIIVDVQSDFLPGGAFAVPRGNQIIPVINELLQLSFDVIIATKDWHPKKHCSFASTHGKSVGERVNIEGIEQILWPDHCVQNTPGSSLSKQINSDKIDEFIYKGTALNVDSYSTFFDNKHGHDTGLDALLKKYRIDEIYLAGLATDYCVKYSVLDARRLGYRVFVIQEGCRPINLNPHDEENAFSEMRLAGAEVINLETVKNIMRDQ